jgi:hypothetical protein
LKDGKKWPMPDKMLNTVFIVLAVLPSVKFLKIPMISAGKEAKRSEAKRVVGVGLG